MMGATTGYMVTWTTYGTWLQGDERGYVKDGEAAAGCEGLRQANAERRKGGAMRLDRAERRIVRAAIQDEARRIGAHILAVAVWSNHVHVVITADCKPEKVMADLKAWCSRRLRETFGESSDRDRWTQHGSTRYLNDQRSFDAAVKYVIDEQGDAMELYDYRNENEPEA